MFKLEVIRNLIGKKEEVETNNAVEYEMVDSNFTVKDYSFTYNMLRVSNDSQDIETIIVDDHVDRFYYGNRKKDLLYNLANSIVSGDGNSNTYYEIVSIVNGVMDIEDSSPFGVLRAISNSIDLRIRYDITPNSNIEIKGSDKIYFIKHLINAYNIRMLSLWSDNKDKALSNLLWSTQCANLSSDSYGIPYKAIHEYFIPYMSVTVLATLFKDNSYRKALDIRACNVTGRFIIRIKDFNELNKIIDEYADVLKQ